MSALTEAEENVSDVAINLLRGWPSKALLPVDLIREAANAVLSDPTVASSGLLYGPDPGYEPCREALAEWLETFYQPSRPIEAARICITGGASQSLGCLLGVYTDPVYTRNIWLVAPAYMLVFQVFEDAGFGGKMRAVPEVDEGMDIEYLRRGMEKSEEKAKREGNVKPGYKPNRQRAKVFKHIIYAVPTFSNPSSRTMSLQRRRELVHLAREFDALVTCDDVYDFLQWPADACASRPGTEMEAMKTAHLPRIVDIDRELDGGTDRDGADGFGNACSNGTMSKIAGPGLRMGWVEAASKFTYGLSQAGIQRSGGAPSQLTSTYVARLITNGQIQNHLETVLRPAYASRYRIMINAIEGHLRPLGYNMPQPDRDVSGGYFIWLSLPTQLRASELAQKCAEKEKLVIATGNIFEVPGDEAASFDHSIRLCFAWEDEPLLEEGVKRIARATQELLKRQDNDGGEYVVVDRASEDNKLQAFM